MPELLISSVTMAFEKIVFGNHLPFSNLPENGHIMFSPQNQRNVNSRQVFANFSPFLYYS